MANSADDRTELLALLPTAPLPPAPLPPSYSPGRHLLYGVLRFFLTSDIGVSTITKVRSHSHPAKKRGTSNESLRIPKTKWRTMSGNRTARAGILRFSRPGKGSRDAKGSTRRRHQPNSDSHCVATPDTRRTTGESDGHCWTSVRNHQSGATR